MFRDENDHRICSLCCPNFAFVYFSTHTQKNWSLLRVTQVPLVGIKGSMGEQLRTLETFPAV